MAAGSWTPRRRRCGSSSASCCATSAWTSEPSSSMAGSTPPGARTLPPSRCPTCCLGAPTPTRTPGIITTCAHVEGVQVYGGEGQLGERRWAYGWKEPPNLRCLPPLAPPPAVLACLRPPACACRARVGAGARRRRSKCGPPAPPRAPPTWPPPASPTAPCRSCGRPSGCRCPPPPPPGLCCCCCAPGVAVACIRLLCACTAVPHMRSRSCPSTYLCST